MFRLINFVAIVMGLTHLLVHSKLVPSVKLRLKLVSLLDFGLTHSVDDYWYLWQIHDGRLTFKNLLDTVLLLRFHRLDQSVAFTFIVFHNKVASYLFAESLMTTACKLEHSEILSCFLWRFKPYRNIKVITLLD